MSTPTVEEQRAELEAKLAELGPKPSAQRWKVVVTDPTANGRIVFSSVSEARARTWFENHHPTGYGWHLESPTGECFHYMKNRLDGNKGLEADEWQAYDPSTYTRPEMNAPPGQDAWADTEA